MAPSVSLFSGGSRTSHRRWGGAGHPDPEIRGGQVPPKKLFRPFGSQFGLQIRGVGRACRLDPPLVLTEFDCVLSFLKLHGKKKDLKQGLLTIYTKFPGNPERSTTVLVAPAENFRKQQNI